MDLASNVQRITARFPNINQVSTDDCLKMLESDHPPVMLDCRGEDEFKVSRIEDALWCSGNLTDDKVASTLSKCLGQDVICYCAVGFRACTMAKRIQNLKLPGVKQVSNLEGAIFKWVNEGKTVVGGDGAAIKKVHAFSAIQAKFLKDPDVVFLPNQEDELKI